MTTFRVYIKGIKGPVIRLVTAALGAVNPEKHCHLKKSLSLKLVLPPSGIIARLRQLYSRAAMNIAPWSYPAFPTLFLCNYIISSVRETIGLAFTTAVIELYTVSTDETIQLDGMNMISFFKKRLKK